MAGFFVVSRSDSSVSLWMVNLFLVVGFLAVEFFFFVTALEAAATVDGVEFGSLLGNFLWPFLITGAMGTFAKLVVGDSVVGGLEVEGLVVGALELEGLVV